MKPLSNDLRERILAAVDRRGGSRRQLAVRFAVNVSTITRLLQLRRETGAMEPRPHRHQVKGYSNNSGSLRSSNVLGFLRLF